MKALVSWSSGKDSAWMLHVLRQQGVEVVGLLTTVREGSARVAIHDVRPELLAAQADAARLPLVTLPLPDPCPNAVYEQVMSEAMRAAVARGVTHAAFGDLFLADIRAYRESRLAGSGISPLFPLFGKDTTTLGREMVDAGLRAVLTTVDPRRLDASFCGRTFDAQLLADLPKDVDPCGENGEFHSFAYEGPMFDRSIAVRASPPVTRDGFVYADVQLA